MRSDMNEAVVIDASGAVLLMNPYQSNNINDSVNDSLNNSGENNMKQDNSKQNLNPKYSSGQAQVSDGMSRNIGTTLYGNEES